MTTDRSAESADVGAARRHADAAPRPRPISSVSPWARRRDAATRPPSWRTTVDSPSCVTRVASSIEHRRSLNTNQLPEPDVAVVVFGPAQQAGVGVGVGVGGARAVDQDARLVAAGVEERHRPAGPQRRPVLDEPRRQVERRLQLPLPVRLIRC